MANWRHQAYEYQVGREKRSRALIWPMRSGKSKACIDKACYQFERGRIEGVLVVAPNGVHLNWAQNEIPKWVWPEIGPYAVFAWETQKRGYIEQDLAFNKMCAAPGLKFFTINMEALKHLDCRRAVKDFMKACHGKFMLIVSEAHHFGHAGSKRTYFARSLSYHAEFVQTETGTPILTGPLRAFSQYELLAPGALGFKTYTPFKHYFAEWEPSRPGSRHKYTKVKKYLHLDELREKIGKWSSVVLREDLEDMPDLIRTERPVVMSPKQRISYLQMVSHHLAELGEDVVTVPDAGPRMMKLQQILHGYIIDSKTDRLIEIDKDAPIYNALDEEVQGTMPGKVLVWCRYKEDIRRVSEKLARFGVLQYHGDLTATARERNRKLFLKDDKYGVIVGTPDTGGEGLDFSAADAVIFFSIPPNARMVAQAEERATVKGGKSVAIIRIRNYGTVDDRLWEIVDGSISLADTITGRGLRDLLRATDL
jgi:DNA-binding MurR/RpiR family transcriptional regulator